MPHLRPVFTILSIVALATATLAPANAQSSRDLPRTHAPRPTKADITVEDVKTRTYIIADDSMEGRDTGRRGGLRWARYIAAELKRLGLEPAGDNGTYLQQIPWLARTPDTTAVLRVGTTTLRWGTDYLVVPKLGFALALGGQPFGGGFRGEKSRRCTAGTSAIRRSPPTSCAERSSCLERRHSRSGSATTCGVMQARAPSSLRHSISVHHPPRAHGARRTGIRPRRAAWLR